jgi:hypothetical protein
LGDLDIDQRTILKTIKEIRGGDVDLIHPTQNRI